MTTTADAPGVAYSSAPGRWIVAATVLGSGMAAIDATVVGIALPSIGKEFHASFGTLQWVATAYMLTLAALLLVGGSLGDRLGRRKVFCFGVIWFTVASAVCAAATGPTMLIVTRALQGVGAALLTPGSLAIIQASFVKGDRSRAIGAWSGLGGVATAAGPLLGGYLIGVASWRWIFLINVPVGVFVVWVAARHVPESFDVDAAPRTDVAGAVLAVLALAGISYGLIEGPSSGWSNGDVVASLAIGSAAAIGFLAVERAVTAPMLPLSIFRLRQFSVTTVVTLVVYGALGGALFLLPVQLQVVGGYTPLQAGAALLPLTVIMLLLSARSGQLAGRIGPRLQMSVGPICVGVGLAMLARTSTDPSYLGGVLPAVIVLGLGLATTVAPLTATALGALPDHRAGLASAVNNDVARLGGLIAVAVLPSIAGITGATYLDPVALASSFRTAVLIAGGVSALAGVIAAIGIRNNTATDASPHEHCFHCALEAAPLIGRLDEAPPPRA